MESLISREDASVNFVEPAASGRGMLEARYVRREEDYFIVYLSSQAGCNLGCKFCHLTATGQRLGDDATIDDYVRQAQTVLTHYDGVSLPAQRVHFNYMARGEALANKFLLESANTIIDQLDQLAAARSLQPVHKISTIMPAKTMRDRSLADVFQSMRPDIYLSLYSMSPTFRRQWLPGAISAELALDKLKSWQEATGLVPYLHGAFIAGANDRGSDIEAICNALEQRDLKVNINIVRYNPYSDVQGEETAIEQIQDLARLYSASPMVEKVQVVTRVGFDVKASCGMFVAP